MKIWKPASPIEIMINRACGLDGKTKSRVILPVKCPLCSKSATIPAETCYPAGTVRVEMTCPECNPKCDDVRFLDAAGADVSDGPT